MGVGLRGGVIGLVVGLALGAGVAVSGVLAGDDGAAIAAWSGWGPHELALALVLGTPGDDGTTLAERTLDTIGDQCPDVAPEHVEFLSGQQDAVTAVTAFVSLPVVAGCDDSLSGAVGWLDADAGMIHAVGGAEVPQDVAGVLDRLPATTGGPLAPDWSREAPIRTSDDGNLQLPGLPSTLDGSDVAIAMLLGRDSANHGVAAGTVRSTMEDTCGSPLTGVDAQPLGDDRWLVTAANEVSERCPDDLYALAVVDLRTGLVRPPDEQGLAQPDAGEEGHVRGLSLWWRYATWLDRVRATP